MNDTLILSFILGLIFIAISYLLDLIKPKKSKWFEGFLYAEETLLNNPNDLYKLNSKVDLTTTLGFNCEFDKGISDYICHYRKNILDKGASFYYQ